MKLSFLKSKLPFLFLVLIFVFSCSNEDETVDETEFSIEDNQKAATVDQIIEGTVNIMEAAYVEEEEGRMNSFFPPCATITVTVVGENVNLVVDFGDGCTFSDGTFVTGIINLSYGPIVNNSRIIDYNFEAFTYNLHAVSGGGQIERVLENQNGNPQSTVNEEITVGFPQSTLTATRTGLRIAEWIEGVGSGTWMDNVFLITGNWNTVFSNGFTRSGEVTVPLVKKANCLYIVSGEIDFTQNGFNATIDYGEGTCDNIVTVFFNGQVYTILL